MLNRLDKNALARRARANFAAALRLKQCLQRRAARAVARHVVSGKRHVMRSQQRSAQRRLKQTADDSPGRLDRLGRAGNDKTAAFNAQSNGDIFFQGREILIELSEEPNMVVQAV